MNRKRPTDHSETLPIPRLLLLILLLLFAGAIFSYAATMEDLVASSVSLATETELQQMLAIRGLSTEGSIEQQRQRLLQAFAASSTEVVAVVQDDDKQAYALEILGAQKMTNMGGEDGLVLLEGGVQISFTPEGRADTMSLSADRMIVDLINTRLTAMGNVKFHDNAKDSVVQEVGGDIVSIDWHTGNLEVSGGMTSSKKKNSEDKEVEIFTSGMQINYRGEDGGIGIEDGLITTNPKTAYSSITAKSLSMLPGGDMFVTNAYLSIGRVPVFWVPFFFYPGSTMVFNPAFGFTSDRGMFLNTTYEMYGTYPKIKSAKQSSFSSFLASDDQGSSKQGLIYGTSDAEPTSFESWASSSGSYLAVMADAYQKAGIYLGIDSLTNLWNKKLKIEAGAGFGLTPPTWGSGGTSSLGTAYHTPFRYLGNVSVALDTSYVDLTLAMPFYSDPTVQRLYGNRLTSFSMDALFGSSQDFPTDFSSTISSFTWKGSGSITVPTKAVEPYISSLKISKLEASVVFQWLQDPNNSSAYTYRINSMTLPNLTASMGGTLFSFESKAVTTSASQAKDLTALESQLLQLKETPQQETASAKASESEVLPSYLPKPYEVAKAKDSNASASGCHKLSLGYTIDQTLTNKYADNSTTSSSGYTVGPQTLYSATKGTLTFSGAIAPSWFTFTQKFLPSYIYTLEESNKNYQLSNMQFLSSTTATVPIIGLTYELVSALYTYKSEESDNEAQTTTEQWAAWNNQSITTHRLSLSKSWTTTAGTFTPSVTTVLPPLNLSVTPAFAWALGNLSAKASYKFAQQSSGALVSDLISLTFAYNGQYFATSVTSGYQTANIGATQGLLDPLTIEGYAALQFFSKRLVIRQGVDYAVLSKNQQHLFESLETKIAWRDAVKNKDRASVALTFAGPAADLQLSSFDLVSDVADVSFSWWKRRITLGFGLVGKFHFDFQDRYATNLSITANLSFSIAEFLSLKMSVTSSNSGFYSYYVDDVFQWDLMFKDLMRSFDFFGNGRTSTYFNMEGFSIDLIHYMEDWDLHCKYSGSVVLSGNNWSWVPKFSIFLQWKTIPELKVDEKWTQSGSTWTKGS